MTRAAATLFRASVTWCALGASGCVVDTTGEHESENVDTSSEALSATPPVKIRHVVLLSGGFGSCNPSGTAGVLPTEARTLLDSIESNTGLPPYVVRTCFGGVGDADRFEYVVTMGALTYQAGSTSLWSLESTLQKYLAANAPSRLDAYGHSHGGWLVGRVVQDLGPGIATSYTLNVFLSDAISRTLCTPAVVISGVGRSDYCGRFPADLDPYTIRANTHGYLGTAFQTDDWLHSAPILTGSVENRFFNPGLRIGVTAQNHRALYTLPLAYAGIPARFQYR